MEGFGGLFGQGVIGSVGDGVGDYYWQLCVVCIECFFQCIQCGFGVECVEDGFDYEGIGVVVDQVFDCFVIGIVQFIEVGVVEVGIVYVWVD